MQCLGIDPGVSGAMCLYTSPAQFTLWKTAEYHKVFLLLPLFEFDYDKDAIVVESVRASAKMSQAKAFTFGREFGKIEGALAWLPTTACYAEAKQWQKHYKMPSGMDYAQRKAWLWDKAIKISGCDIPKYAADAYLIARWGAET